MKELEERGIGRPSTYASVIDTIVNKRDYVWKKGNALVPTWTAFAKVQLLERYFAHLIDYEFTATMEEALDAIARGEGEAEKWLHSFYFGNGQVGLRDLVAEEHLATIDKAEVNAVHLGDDGDGRELDRPRVAERRQHRAWRREGSDPGRPRTRRAHARRRRRPDREGVGRPAAARRGSRDRPAGARAHRPLRARSCSSASRRKARRRSRSARRSSRAWTPNTVTLDEALGLLSLPRVVGVDADGEEITAQNGRYGPVPEEGHRQPQPRDPRSSCSPSRSKKRRRSSPSRSNGAAASRKPPLAELGAHPESGAPVRVLDGRFGPYVTDGTLNASVPRGIDAEAVTLEQAVELLRERAARAPATSGRRSERSRRRPAKKPRRKKATAKKATKKAAKKATAKKTTAKRTTAKGAVEKAIRRRPRRLIRHPADCARRAEDGRRATGKPWGAVHPARRRQSTDAARAVARVRHAVVLPAVARAGDLEPRRLDRAHRDPRDRGTRLRQLGCRGEPRDGDACAARVPPRHRRRRDHRPVRPAQGDGAVRHRSRQPALPAAVRGEPPRVGAGLARPRADDAALGPGAGGDGSALREGGAARIGELAVARRVVRHVPDRVDHLLVARRPRHRARSARHHLGVRGRPGVARARSSTRCTFLVSAAIVWRLPFPRQGTRRQPAHRLARHVQRHPGGPAVHPTQPAGAGRDHRARVRPHRRRRDDPARSGIRQAGAGRRQRRVRRADDRARLRCRDRRRHACSGSRGDCRAPRCSPPRWSGPACSS